MYGKDIEVVLEGLNKIKDNAKDAIIALALRDRSRYGKYINNINQAYNGISANLDQIKTFGKNLYVDPTQYNNSYGSPFTECEQFRNAIDETLKYDRKKNVFGSLEEKSDMNSLLSMLEGMTADCKQSLTEYQDDIQRNFDDKNGSPSITWVKNSTGERTAGNTDPVTPLDENLKNLNLDTVMDKLSDLGLGFNIGG